MGLREIKTEARRALHQAMRVPASYYETPLSTPRLIHVRVHSKMVQHGDLKGTNLNYAEMMDISPTLVFDREEVALPAVKALVIISDTEGYRVGPVEAPDGITIKAQVSRLSPNDLVGKTLPGDL